MTSSLPDPPYAQRLRAVVAVALPLLEAMPDAAVSARATPNAWSPREIIGHLIDSASNNHQRFVRAVDQDDLVFPGYAQDRWVTVQEYNNAPWDELLALWSAFNRHMARVMSAIPPETRQRARSRHNLDEIAWRTLPASEWTTLDYFMADYVGHLEHHLAQVLGAGWSDGLRLPPSA